MKKPSNASMTVVSSVIQVRRFLQGLNLSYTASVTIDSRYRHIVHAVLGKPRPDTPCPLAVVHLKFTLKDDMREIISYEIENDRHVYRLRDNIEFDERLLDRVIARKIALKRSGLIDLSDEYIQSRVMEPKYDAKDEDPDARDPVAIRLQLVQMFEEYDTNHDGSITYLEFRGALKSGTLREDEIELLFTQPDLDRNGRINYEEFSRSAADILGRMPSGYKYKDHFNELYDDYLDYFHEETILTMQILNQAFEAADYLPPNSSGRRKANKLNYDTFHKCLSSPLANLSREEINLAISLVPMDENGLLEYNNFEDILAKALFSIAQGQCLGLSLDIESYLINIFENAEREYNENSIEGFLPRGILYDALHTLKKLMLSRGQIILLIGYAKENNNGLVEYLSYARKAAEIIKQFINPKNIEKKIKKNNKNTIAAIFNGINEKNKNR